MRLFAILFGAAALVIVLHSNVAAQDSPHERALAAIRKLGGQVVQDRDKPGTPVSVVLTGSADPAKCMPYLKDVRNLHTCDL